MNWESFYLTCFLAGLLLTIASVAFGSLHIHLHVPHGFRIVPGAGHGWALWTSQLDRELRFLESALAGTPGGQAAPGGGTAAG